MEPSPEDRDTVSSNAGTQPNPDNLGSNSNQLASAQVDGMKKRTAKDSDCRGLRIKKRPLVTTLFIPFCQWLITAITAGSIFAVLTVYSNKPAMSQVEKRVFNALITGLSICLGLAIATSLDDMIEDLRWWILSRKYRSMSEVALILEADRMRHLVTLLFKSRRTTTQFAAWTWVAILVASQVGVASLGLCYSTDPAETEARFVPGNVSIPNMTTIETTHIVSAKSSTLSAQQYTANSFGTISLAFKTDVLENVPEPRRIWSSDDPLMFCGDKYCRYIFHETSTKSLENVNLNPIVVTTDRSLDVSTRCASWPVIRRYPGPNNTMTISTSGGGVNISIPIARGLDGTVYMTDTTQNCGADCGIVSVLEDSTNNPWYYECNVTVANVSQASQPEHQVGSQLRSVASTAIALQGYDIALGQDITDTQHQTYPIESVFGTPANGSTEVMALLISRFSIGVIAIVAENNDYVVIHGDAPTIGVQLNVSHRDIIIIILILIVVTQLILGMIVAMLVHRIVVPRREGLQVARVCRAMTEQCSENVDGNGNTFSSNPTQTSYLWAYRNKLVSFDGVYEVYMEKRPEMIDPARNEVEKNASDERNQT